MVNDSCAVLDKDQQIPSCPNTPSKLNGCDKSPIMNGHGERHPHHHRGCGSPRRRSKESLDEEDEITGLNNGHGEGGHQEDKDKYHHSNSSSTSSPLVPRARSTIKSATLMPTSVSGRRTFPQTNKNNNSSHQTPFLHNARNSFTRSFTLPRGLLLRKTGQTGPVSENQNGSFVRNIFLTLVRSKSVRRKRNKEVLEGEGDMGGNNEEMESSQNKLHGLPPGFVPAAVGLKNQGNTCFMNAIVQCLSHTDSLAKYLVTDNYKSDLRRKYWIKNGKSEVTDELASVLKSAWLRQNTSVLEEAVSKFKAAVEKGALQWRGAEQHDAQEFFLWLLDKLHEDLNQASSHKYKQLKNNYGRPEEQVAAEALANHLRCNNSIIQDIFGAHFRSSLTCPGCGRQSATFDPFLCVSLPIPQAKQEVPVYVNIIYLSQQPRQVKLGLSISSSADIKELKQLLAADTGIEENNILLTEVDGEGFHRTFTETQLVASLAQNEALYCIETPQIRETTENDGAFLMITWANLLVGNDEEKTKVRFGSTYVTQVARETGFVDLQKILLKEMAAVLHPGILVAEQKDPVFSIRILDGTPEGGLVDPSVEHPLYMEAVDHALSLCDEDVPPHIKLQLEWEPINKEKIIADDSETVEEHESVAQVRQRHAEETVGSVSLTECFDLYTSAEQLSAEDSWHCPYCNRKEQGTLKMIGLWTAPQVLVVHLKRFRQTAKGRVTATKISSVVDFPVEGLDLRPHVARHSSSRVPEHNNMANGSLNPVSSPINGCFGLGNWKHRVSFKKHIVSSTNNSKTVNSSVQNGQDDSLIYDLYAVCNHHGKDMLGGHYTAYCKNPVDESWWSFDDTRVTQVSSPDEIRTASAYILFYSKRPSSSNNSQITPTSNPFQQHWCKTLIKKYHKPNLISSIEASQSKETKDQNVTSTIDKKIETDFDENPKSEPPLVNGYHKDSETSDAPLARMDDVGLNVSINNSVKDLQIESTV